MTIGMPFGKTLGTMKGQQICWHSHDTWSLRMPSVCAITGEPADTAIILAIGDSDLILPASERIRAEHNRRLGQLRTAWRLRPTVDDDVVTLHNLSRAFVDALLKLNEPGLVCTGGLRPLKPMWEQTSTDAFSGRKAA